MLSSSTILRASTVHVKQALVSAHLLGDPSQDTYRGTIPLQMKDTIDYSPPDHEPRTITLWKPICLQVDWALCPYGRKTKFERSSFFIELDTISIKMLKLFAKWIKRTYHVGCQYTKDDTTGIWVHEDKTTQSYSAHSTHPTNSLVDGESFFGRFIIHIAGIRLLSDNSSNTKDGKPLYTLVYRMKQVQKCESFSLQEYAFLEDDEQISQTPFTVAPRPTQLKPHIPQYRSYEYSSPSTTHMSQHVPAPIIEKPKPPPPRARPSMMIISKDMLSSQLKKLKKANIDTDLTDDDS